MVELKQLYKRSSSHPRTDIQTVREKIGSKMSYFDLWRNVKRFLHFVPQTLKLL